MMEHVGTVNAFKNKFGTYTGAIHTKATREVVRERFETYDEARNWVKSQAWKIFGGSIKFAAITRKGEYLANVWKV